MIMGSKELVAYGERSHFVTSVRMVHPMGGRPSPDAFGKVHHVAFTDIQARHPRGRSLMFDLEIDRIRSSPMALQRLPHGSIIHLHLPSMLLAVPR
jgi:hypothetical protein